MNGNRKGPFSLYLSIDLMNKVDQVAERKHTKVSPLVETVLTEFVKSEFEIPDDENKEPEFIYPEPNEDQCALPKSIDEIQKRLSYQIMIDGYFGFLDQNPYEFMTAQQVRLICQLIASQSMKMQLRSEDSFSFIETEIVRLKQYRAAMGIPAIRRNVRSFEKQIRGMFATEFAAANPAPLDDWRERIDAERQYNAEAIDKIAESSRIAQQVGALPAPSAKVSEPNDLDQTWLQIAAVLDPDFFPIADDDICKALGDTISANVINALMVEHGFIATERSDGFIEYTAPK